MDDLAILLTGYKQLKDDFGRFGYFALTFANESSITTGLAWILFSVYFLF